MNILLPPDADLHLFGSSCNGFGFTHSDLDICMTGYDAEVGVFLVWKTVWALIQYKDVVLPV